MNSDERGSGYPNLKIGNDGLTDAERDELAQHYKNTACAPLTAQEKALATAKKVALRNADLLVRLSKDD